jgi:hypothetical protein
MYRITNIDSLGTDYTVADADGNILKTVQVIPHTEILDAALGIYNDAQDTLQDYIERSVALLSGYEEVSPYRVYWYATTEDEVVLSDIIEYAVTNGYDKIILEHLDDDEQTLLQ